MSVQLLDPNVRKKTRENSLLGHKQKAPNFLHFTHYDFTAISCISISLRKSLTMETNNDIEDMEEEEEFGFSRNYFLAKELGSSGKKSARKLSEINLVDEQVLALKF